MQTTEEFYTTEENKIGGGPDFINAVRQGKLQIVKDKLNAPFMIRARAEQNDEDKKSPDWNKSALYIAFEKGYTEIFNLLIDKGANISNALKWAIKSKNLINVKFFLEFIKKEKKELQITNTELYNTIESKSIDIAYELMKYLPEKEKETLLIRFFKENDHTQLQHQLMASKINVSLYIAIITNNIVLAEFLLYKKGNPNILIKSDKTALVYSLDEKNYDMVILLLRYGADPNINLNLNDDEKKNHFFPLYIILGKVIEEKFTHGIIPDKIKEAFLLINERSNYDTSLVLNPQSIYTILSLVDDTNYLKQIKVYTGIDPVMISFDVDRLITYLSYTSKDINNGNKQKEYLYDYLVESIKTQLSKI